MTSQVAENYQLKWHSHLTNLNSSVATLYRNEKFADVLLFTSNSENCTGIPAHKIILSSCSHFFASIFDGNPSPPNAMIYIILPPELSKRAIQILIQYMYSGEATVSNDILNEVLRGGELLKIRGLWRNNQTSEPNASSTPQYQQHQSSTGVSSTSKNVAEYNNFNKENSINVEKSIFEHRSERLSVSSNNTAVIKESPVIVMSPRHVHIPNIPITQNVQSSTHTSILKKDIPAENTSNEHSTQQGFVPCSNSSIPLKMPTAAKKNSSEKRQNGMESRRSKEDFNSISTETNVQSHREPETQQHSTVDNRRLNEPEQQIRSGHHIEPGETSSMLLPKIIIDKKSFTSKNEHIPEALSFLTIKQEPIEWTEYEQENCLEKPHIEVTVKPEMTYAEDGDSDEEGINSNSEMVYSPLTCELCSETFTVPAEWVRHIEGHTEATQCVPKKRKRLNESTCDNIAALRCDLCSMYFITPAEWVRHVQNTHTENELALSNNRTPPKRNQRFTRPPLEGQPLEKSCSVCRKSFPSYASMVIHKRTHTGERPFYCILCNKGFNVKSNLLRHMRTLHNQLLNPSNINDLSNNVTINSPE